MFELFTESSRRCIFFARYEATHLGSQYIEPEHLLLGLIRENTRNGNRVLNQFLSVEQTPEIVRQKILDSIPPNDTLPATIDLPLSANVKQILSIVFEQARKLGQERVGFECFLFGILVGPESNAKQILKKCGVTVQAVENFISAQK